LPEYLLPNAIVPVEAFPRTSSGKIDRQSLPAPEVRAALGASYVAPETPLEEILADIWSEVLDVRRVGTTDDFFLLGGHSLLATQVIARIRATLHIELPLRTLFETPTIAGMVRSILRAELDPGRTERIARLLVSVDAMTDEQALIALRAAQRDLRSGAPT
jgi:acyl carrier protein